MAKKVIATLKDSTGKNIAKVIRCMKSKKTGSYTFKESIVLVDDVKKLLSK